MRRLVGRRVLIGGAAVLRGPHACVVWWDIFLFYFGAKYVFLFYFGAKYEYKSLAHNHK